MLVDLEEALVAVERKRCFEALVEEGGCAG
jgi:hypothetical protein